MNRALKIKLNRISDQRSNGEKYRNHLWTRRIIEQAVRCEAGNLVMVNTPTDSQLFGHPWGWHQFKTFLEYKAKELGIKVQYIDTRVAEAA